MSKPVIGIPTGFKDKSEFSRTPHYALTRRFMRAVAAAGGVPVMLGYEEAVQADYIDLCDGFLLPDGRYRYREDWYDPNAEPVWSTPTIRGPFDLNFGAKVLASRKPVLGVCAGMQLIAGLNGSTFYGDVKSELLNAQDHLSPPAEEAVHRVKITPNTLLHSIIPLAELAVNTSHKEAVRKAGAGVKINAVGTDGVVEGIELENHPFALGVQWHPEFYDCFAPEVGTHHAKLFEALVQAC